ncbi:methylglyoxal reductase (NADPH-dependent) gre2 [Hypoxylon texense]
MTATPSINSLPYEVRQTIYSLLGQHHTNSYRWHGGPTSTIAHYATVSREWQEEFERFTFREIRVTPSSLQRFTHILKSPRRRAIVQTLRYHISLDTYPSYLDGEQETSAERRRSTEIVTEALGTFFAAMTNWQKMDTSPLGLDLHLLIDSPNDSSTSLGRNGTPLVTGRAMTSHLKLNLETLSLPVIDIFSGFRCTGRHMQPTSLLAIVSKLRMLEYLDVELNHDSARKRDVQQRNSLEQYAETVRVLSLRRPSPMITPSTAPPKQPWSDFYSHLRAFSQQCESFEFDDCIDAAQFFVPFTAGPSSPNGSPKSHEEAAPFWPQLKRLNVRNSYMMKEPYLRVPTRVEALAYVRKVLVAIGRASMRMPELQFARVCQYVLNDGQLEWFVLTYECYAGRAVLRLRGFVPGKAMIDAWKHPIAEKRAEFHIHVEGTDANAPEL